VFTVQMSVRAEWKKENTNTQIHTECDDKMNRDKLLLFLVDALITTQIDQLKISRVTI
jgi:hypothetical protein